MEERKTRKEDRNLVAKRFNEEINKLLRNGEELVIYDNESNGLIFIETKGINSRSPSIEINSGMSFVDSIKELYEVRNEGKRKCFYENEVFGDINKVLKETGLKLIIKQGGQVVRLANEYDIGFEDKTVNGVKMSGSIREITMIVPYKNDSPDYYSALEAIASDKERIIRVFPKL